MIERIFIGGCLIFMIDVEMGLVLPIAVFFFILIVVVIRRPYLKLMHNVRFAVNMLICIAILAIYLGYKKANFADRNK